MRHLHVQLLFIIALILIQAPVFAQAPAPPPPPVIQAVQTTCTLSVSPNTVRTCTGVPVALSANGAVRGSDLIYGTAANQYVSIGNSPALTSYSSQMTISAWVKLNNADLQQDVVSFMSGALNDGFVLGVANGGLYAQLYDAASASYTFASVGVVPANTWVQIALTYNANDSVRVYINGTEVAAQAAGTANIASNSGMMTFGISSADQASFAVNGEIDEVRFYSTALTSSQMAATYNVSLPVTTPGMIGYWRFDEGEGIVTTDATGNGNKGVLVSASQWNTYSSLPLIYPVSYSWTQAAGLSSDSTQNTIAIVSSPTTFYVVMTEPTTGCSASDSVLVNALPPVPAMATATPQGICPGDTSTLSVSGLSTLTWTEGGENTSTIGVAPLSNTSYIVTGMDSNTCSHSDTVAVSVYSLPVVPTISQYGDSLVSSPASSYQWYRNGTAITGATGASYLPTISGSYTVEVFNPSGCSAMSSPASLALGISEVSGTGKVTCFPNPTNGPVHITVADGGSYQITVLDALGKKLISASGEKTETTLDLSALGTGTYVIQITGSTVNAASKIVKE